MSETMYKRYIMEIYSERPNYGELKNKNCTLKHQNPSCNDEITIELLIKDNKIINAKFSGISCFISTVSASVLLKKIRGMKISEIKKLTKKDMDKLLGIEVTPARISCELLPLEALRKIKEK